MVFYSETPGHGSGWAETPRTDRGGDAPSETPTPGSKRRSRWDETPAGSQTPSATPIVGNTATPMGQKAMVMQTPSQTGKWSYQFAHVVMWFVNRYLKCIALKFERRKHYCR